MWGRDGRTRRSAEGSISDLRKTMTLALLGIGTAVPEMVLSNDAAQRLARVLSYQDADRLSWLEALYKGIGCERRHICLDPRVFEDIFNGTRLTGSDYLPTGHPSDQGPTIGQRMREYHQTAGPLALQAARAALTQSRVDPEEITHVVTVSCTGFTAPGVDIELIRGLGLPPSTQRTHVGFMGCHGALNGLRVAAAFTGADPAARVLCCAVELCGLHYFYGWDPQKIVANAIFADGAAAVIGVSAAKAPAGSWHLTASGTYLLPNSLDAMTWTIQDHGFEMTLSKQVPQLIGKYLRPWLSAWLQQQGVNINDVGSWAIHPGGPRIVAAVEEALNLPRSATATAWEVFRDFGNMSSPTVLFIIDKLRQARAPRPCVAIGFGPGLTAEVALWQ
jgi:predicted naringenin-chalcone synthase